MENFPEPLSMMELYQATNREERKKIFGVLKAKEDTSLAKKAKNPFNYASGSETQPSFIHSQVSNQTCLLFPLNSGSPDLHCFNKEDQKIFQDIYWNFSNFSFNQRNINKASMVQNIISSENIKENKLVAKYFDFIKDVCKLVYKNIYDSKINVLGLNLSDFEEMETPGKDEVFTLGYDLLNASTIRTIIPIYEALEKITDDEVHNCFVLSSLNFTHHLNWLLSPAALSLSFFHYRLLSYKKPYKDENYYNKQCLPKVTYLSLTGFYSEMDIDILHSFSENIQSIFVYDENTGGPSFSIKKNEFIPEFDLRKTKKHFSTISDKLLLIPLKNSSSYSPNDILTIIESMVMRSIEKYKPSFIILNCSLIFEQNNQSPFWIDEEVFGYIVNLLSQVCDNKVIVYPFKLPDVKTFETRHKFSETWNLQKSNLDEKQTQRMGYIIEKYGVPYNETYLRNCFINSVEVLSGLRENTFWNREIIKKKYKPNAALSQNLYNIGRAYKDSPFLHFLHSKTLGPLAKAANQELVTSRGFEDEEKLSNTITLYDPQKKVSQLKLENSDKEVILDHRSQYFVDYNGEKPIVYIFNARQSTPQDEFSSFRTYEPLSHFALTLGYDTTSQVYFVEEYAIIQIEESSEFQILKDSGICKCESYIFQVYGTKVGKDKDSTTIYYYDFKKKGHYEIKRLGNEEVMPRHSVTTCAFQQGNTYFLYVFGGQIQPRTMYKTKEFGGLDIIDIIEVYSTTDPTSSIWNYKTLHKESAFKQVSFIPFTQSYAHYLEANNTILIMGGKVFKESVYDSTFPVFRFDVNSNKFVSFDLYFNETQKDETNKKTKKIKRSMAIADKNKNVKIDKENDSFNFVISPDEDFAIFCTFDMEKDCCEYEEIRFSQEESNIEKNFQTSSSFSNPLTQKPPNARLLTKIRYLFDTKAAKMALLELIKRRLERKEECIKTEIIMSELEEIETNCLSTNTSEECALHQEKIKNLLKNKDFEEILQNQGYKLQFLKTFLEENMEAPIEKKSETAVTNPASFGSILSAKNVKDINQTLDSSLLKKDIRNPFPSIDTASTAPTFGSNKYEEEGKISFTQSSLKNNEESLGTQDFRKLKQIIEKIVQDFDNKTDSKTLELVKQLNKSMEFGASQTDSIVTAKTEGSLLEQSRILDLSQITNSSTLNANLAQKVLSEPIKKPTTSQNTTILSTKQTDTTMEEEKIDHVGNFKRCLATPNPHKLFFNSSKSEIILPTFEGSQYLVQRLRLKTEKIVENSQVVLEDISFELSPSCIGIYQNAVICYIDEYFKVRYPHIFEDYRNCVMYADLEKSIKQLQEGKRWVNLVFKKLFLVTHNHHIFNRCLFTNEEGLFLLGGKHYNFKGKSKKNPILSNDVSLFTLGKLIDVNQNNSDFRDFQADQMEFIKGESVALIHQKKVFICQRKSPSDLEIFNVNGIAEDKIDFPQKYKDYFAHMNLVNFRKKDEILIILYSQDKNLEFLLFDPNADCFEEDKVSLVPQEENEEDKKFLFIYTGLEEFQINVGPQPLQEILIYHFREDKPKVLTCNIQVGN